MSTKLLSHLFPDHRFRASEGNVPIAGLASDSREVEKGFLFAALAGSRDDGARYVGAAVKQGAAAVLAAKADVAGDAAVTVIESACPRRDLALAAARFHAGQPETTVAVTGTNGKTSIAAFVRQIWETMGFRAASIGTVGIDSPLGHEPLAHTSPDPIALHRILRRLVEHDVSHCVIEASSHGLDQHRLDGVRLSAAGFTNISRDHLDYHASFKDYLAAKTRLFSEVLQAPAAAVLNADADQSAVLGEICRKRGVRVVTVGRHGEDIRLEQAHPEGFGYHVEIAVGDKRHRVYLPLVGEFQIANALMAAGLVIAAGGTEAVAIRGLERLTGARGRLELVGHGNGGAPVFIDYAHTPDALANALGALRPHASGRLIVVFGCGGDRDRGKRVEMGRAAQRLADVVIVTDDNPRSEDAGAIRGEVMAGCPDGREIGGRAEAIAAGLGALERGDVLLIAGKGHETGQIIGEEVVPFSDHEVVASVLGREEGQ